MTRQAATKHAATKHAATKHAGRPGKRARARPPAARVRRRRLVALSIVLGLLVAGLGYAGHFLLTESSFFTVRNVEVGGSTVVPAEVVRAAAAVPPGIPLISVDTGAVADRVSEVAGVGPVEVSLRWPSTLFIQVTDRVPVAVTAGTGQRRLVDGTGLAYAPAPQPPPPLPALEVVEPSPEDPATVAALQVLAALPDQLRPEVIAVVASSPYTVTVRLAGDRTVRWGSAAQSERKATVLVPLLTRKGSIYDVASPDLPTVQP